MQVLCTPDGRLKQERRSGLKRKTGGWTGEGWPSLPALLRVLPPSLPAHKLIRPPVAQGGSSGEHPVIVTVQGAQHTLPQVKTWSH